MPVIEFILRDSAFHRKSNISAVYHISFSEFLSLWGQTPMWLSTYHQLPEAIGKKLLIRLPNDPIFRIKAITCRNME